MEPCACSTVAFISKPDQINPTSLDTKQTCGYQSCSAVNNSLRMCGNQASKVYQVGAQRRCVHRNTLDSYNFKK